MESVQRRNTLPVSPKPSREEIFLNYGGQIIPGVFEVEDNEEKTMVLETIDEEEDPKKENRGQQYAFAHDELQK